MFLSWKLFDSVWHLKLKQLDWSMMQIWLKRQCWLDPYSIQMGIFFSRIDSDSTKTVHFTYRLHSDSTHLSPTLIEFHSRLMNRAQPCYFPPKTDFNRTADSDTCIDALTFGVPEVSVKPTSIKQQTRGNPCSSSAATRTMSHQSLLQHAWKCTTGFTRHHGCLNRPLADFRRPP